MSLDFRKFPQVNLAFRDKVEVKIKNLTIGGDDFIVIAGPCSIESEEQLFQTAKIAKDNGASILRGGAYKPRTSPYSFQGLEGEGLQILKKASEKYDIPTVTEVLDVETLDKVCEHTDIVQIGSRNMQNFALLKAVGKTNKPIMLKRGYGSTVEEWLYAAEYIILQNGNENVVLCERGIRTFETLTRNTLDLGSLPILKGATALPIIVDPSHGTGCREAIKSISKAALAMEMDGVMIEMHPDPNNAFSDGKQSLDFNQFIDTMQALKKLSRATDKKMNIS